MPVAVALGGETAEALIEGARALDVRRIYIHGPIERPRAARDALKASGVEVCGVGCTDLTALERAEHVASLLRAGAVVVALGAENEGEREAAIEHVARALHAATRRGAPVAVCNGGLLGFEESAWLFEALPRLRFWFDPVGIEAGPPADVWGDAFAPRCAGLFVRCHPDALPAGLTELLPVRVPWVLDLPPETGGAVLKDAAQALRAMLGTS